MKHDEALLKDIKIVGIEGFANCKSNFYTCADGITPFRDYCFSRGINTLNGEIDSGVWAISYFLSMYKYRPEDFVMYSEPKITANNMEVTLDELSECSCYMDRIYPLFSGKKTVKKMITEVLRLQKVDKSVQEIKEMFFLDELRFERPLSQVGNECFRAMAAIGYAHGKKIYCFPWLSKMRFDGYHGNMTGLLHILESLGMIVISPVGRE